MRLACLLFALVLTAGACSTSAPTTDVSVTDVTAARQIALDEPFTVQRGEKVLFPTDDVEIRFDTITNDSRCPADVTCVRAGEAYAHFTLLEADGTATPFMLELEGLITEVQDMERYPFRQVDRFSVALLLLQPYPGLAEDADMPTTATLEMRRTMR